MRKRENEVEGMRTMNAIFACDLDRPDNPNPAITCGATVTIDILISKTLVFCRHSLVSDLNMSQSRDDIQYFFAEVAQHSTRTDGWVIIDNNVYDVTAFIDERP